MCCSERIHNYIDKQCRKYHVVIERVDNLDNCASIILVYDNNKIILINSNIKGKQYIFSILHELSHIHLGYVGEAFEKKENSNIKEKIVNANMVIMNKEIIKGCIPWYILLALISEKQLFKSIIFQEVTNV